MRQRPRIAKNKSPLKVIKPRLSRLYQSLSIIGAEGATTNIRKPLYFSSRNKRGRLKLYQCYTEAQSKQHLLRYTHRYPPGGLKRLSLIQMILLRHSKAGFKKKG
jgi:hypothetical protein